jgi:aminoglycoside/choline kinase family phosphotransferase
LIEDLGDVDFATELGHASPGRKSALLDEAEGLLDRLRTIPPEVASRNAPFDAAFFLAELAHTRRYALERGGETPLSAADAAEWESHAGELARQAAPVAEEARRVPVHRDFHANNLIRAFDGSLAMIDFQDLRLGPRDYDGVSLRFERAGATCPPPERDRYCEAVILQRAWKVLGTFEKMLLWGRVVYAPHRETARRVIREWTNPRGPFAPLLRFLVP